ncbi:MAG: hypothetical protein ACI9W6_000943 [Motiliproteus sp.]|jgi:hypothetical protein
MNKSRVFAAGNRTARCAKDRAVKWLASNGLTKQMAAIASVLQGFQRHERSCP